MKSTDTPRLPRRKPEPTLPARWEPRFLDSLDARLALVKRLRQLQADIAAEVQADSLIKRMLVDRLSFLATMLETIESRALLEGHLDTAAAGQWIQAVNCTQGLARMLGLNKATKRVNGSLREYLAAQREAAG